MKNRLIIYIDSERPSCYREFNFHPAYVYAILSLSHIDAFKTEIYTNDEMAEETLVLYGISSERITSLADLKVSGPALVYDPCYPLIEADTWSRIATDLRTGQKPSAVFVEGKNMESWKPSEKLLLKNTELLNCSSMVDVVMIDAFIKSDFYHHRPIKLSSGFKITRSANEGKPKLLFSAPYAFFPVSLKQQIESAYDVIYAFNAPYTVTRDLLADREIWLTGTCPPYYIDANLIRSGRALRIVATPSTGTTHLDAAAVEKAGIRLCSIKTADFLNNIHASSEHTFTLLLVMIKQIPLVTRSANLGTWREQEHIFRSIELHGKTIGIIGYGRIGRNLARYCHAFGMKILAYDPLKKISDTFTEQVEKEVLLTNSDIVSVNYHLTGENHQSFTSADFDRMKTGSYFLNTARGELVDEPAMLEALKTSKLKAAAVDVISDEARPLKWDHPVIEYARRHENLTISPHTAGLTVDSETKAMTEILREITNAINSGYLK
jgi:D-3-phosphoglycerate dehydrogenase / 2-oxoglutarate reductase